MSTRFFSFVYNTLRPRVNDPANGKLWLPTKLEELEDPSTGGRLLPLRVDHWDIGNVTGTPGVTFRDAIIGQYWITGALRAIYKDDPESLAKVSDPEELARHNAIGCPDRPWPRLSVSGLTVHGLDNMLALDAAGVQSTGDGYTATLPLQIGYYDGAGGKPQRSQLRFEARYGLRMCVCTAPSGEASPARCDGWLPDYDVDGAGTVKVTLRQAFVDAQVAIRVAGSGSARTAQVSVTRIDVRGPRSGEPPALSVDELTVDTTWTWLANTIWIPQATRALESEDGRRGLLENLNATLNQPVFLGEVAHMLTEQLNRVLDDSLGRVPSGELPSGGGLPSSNAATLYLFNRLGWTVNSRGGDYYMPRIVCGAEGPTLEPFEIARINVGRVSAFLVNIDDLHFTSVRLEGFSNIAAPAGDLALTESGIDATLGFSTLDPPPSVTVRRNGQTVTMQVPRPPLRFNGRFSGKMLWFTVTGRITIDVRRSSASLSLTLGGLDLDRLQIDMRSARLDAAPSDITISMRVDHGAITDVVISQVVNSVPAVKRAVLNELNYRLSQSLEDLSRMATDHVKRILAAKIDG
jgi:hypothetical protein